MFERVRTKSIYKVLRGLMWAGILQALSASVVSHADSNDRYKELAHRLKITELRAGAHEASGVIHYEFQAFAIAVRNTAEDAEIPLAERKKLYGETHSFFSAELNALQFGKDLSAGTLDYGAEELRQLVAQAMQHFQCKEAEVGLAIKVKILNQKTFLWIFKNTKEVGEVLYYPVPFSSFQNNAVQSKETLRFEDTKGFSVSLSLSEIPSEIQDN